VSAALTRAADEWRRAAGEARGAWSVRATLVCATIAVAAVLPLVTGFLGSLDTLANGLYLALAAVGLGYAVGIGGIPSLAQGAFVGVGAFASALARIHLGAPLLAAALLGTAAAAAAGLAVGVLTVRLRPAATAVATFLVSWLVLLALQAFPSAFGGTEGLPTPSVLSARAHYELALALVVLAGLAFLALARGPAGLRLSAARDRPAAAAAAGVPAARLRVGAFVFAALVGGLAGGLSVDLAGVADPAAYGPGLSFKLLVAVLIGGAASPLAGPAGVTLLGLAGVAARGAAGFSDQLATRFQTMTSAAIVVLMLAAEWDGIMPTIDRLLDQAHPAGAHSTVRGAARPRDLGRAGGPLRAEGLTKRYGALVALDAVDLEVEPGAVRALVGPNGSGKTTALRALAGAIAVDGGRILLGDEDVTGVPVERRVELGVARTLQSTSVFGGLTVLDHVLVGASLRRRYGGSVRTLAATPLHRRENAEARDAALAALDAVGLSAHARDRASTLHATEQRLLMIATALATDPQTILLDEPSAGSGADELPLLAGAILRLRDRGIGLLVVEHNLRLVRTIADRVSVLDAGRLIAEGTPAEVGADPEVRAAYLGREPI
jgi:branched-chain amino acid transport system permease protein